MKNKNTPLIVASARRRRQLLFISAAAAGSVVCLTSSGSDNISYASAFSTSALTSPIRTSSKSSASFISSRSSKYQLYDPRYSYEEQRQQQQYQQEYENVDYNNENNSVEYQTNHHTSTWENFDNNIDDDDTTWFPRTNSLIEEYMRSRQMVVEENGFEGGQDSYHYTNNHEDLSHTNPAHPTVGNANGEEILMDSSTAQLQQHSTQKLMQEADPPTMSTPTPSSTEQLLDSLRPSPIDQEEEFLRMVSNEINYKKFLGQSPYALTDIKVPVLLQRFLDNLEDGTQKNNGKFKGQNYISRKEQPREERKTVIVLGTGWASHAFVKLASTYDLRIVVVSPVNHFVFTPMLASAAVGTVEYRSVTEPIRVTNPYIDNFVEGRAIGIDVEGKKLQVQLSSLGTVTGSFRGLASDASCRLDPEPIQSYVDYSDDGSMVQRDRSKGAGDVIELNYDYLLCAVGTASRSSIVKGAKEYCFNLKTSQDSKRLRTALGEALEYASRPDVQDSYYISDEVTAMARAERRRRVRIAIVGGGPTGVELSGELKDFFAQICSYPDGAYQHLKDDISVMLIHGGCDLLPAMDRELRTRALDALHAQGVEVRLNTRLKEVGRDFITIGEKGSDVEETIPVGLTVWAAGNAPVPFVKELLSQLPPQAAGPGGRIVVDKWLRCQTNSPSSFGSIFVLGDVACLSEKEKYDVEPQPLPQTAQVAGQQGAFAARMLNRGYDMQATPPALPELSESESFSLLRVWLAARGLEEAPGFTFLSLGLLAYVGQEEALNQVTIGNVPIFNYSGKIAFTLWRTVYLAKQASSRNQALLTFDWVRTKRFGRDITRL